MGITKAFKSIFAPLAVSFLSMAVTEFVPALAMAIPEPAKKAYAVFVVSFNPETGQAVGGVAGTAFFVSSRKAITAYHVLQAKSFEPQAGFTQARVWLVHEDSPAIELKTENVQFEKNGDLTEIDFKTRQVGPKFIYQKAVSKGPVDDPANTIRHSTSSATDLSNSLVQTEGFIANTAGPVLAWQGQELVITSVPHLDRIHAEGHLIQKAKIDLHASDVNLQQADCLQLSYQPIQGLSGGPVVMNGRVIAMNSFADPSVAGDLHGLNGKTWAVRLKK